MRSGPRWGCAARSPSRASDVFQAALGLFYDWNPGTAFITNSTFKDIVP